MDTTLALASPNYELLCAGFTDTRPCSERRLAIAATDGIALAATLFEPRAADARLAVLISGAAGVAQRYYRAFAEYLAERGCVVLTYDYRGIGGSRDAGRGARMRDWGERDLAGALEWLLRRQRALPLAAIGHSAGGWLFGLAANNRSADTLFTVGAQSAYWRHWPTLRGRAFMWSSMHLAIPLAVRATGRLPGFLLDGETLPAGVALEWARWCRHPDFLVDDDGAPLREHFRAYENPARLLAIADDRYAPEQAVRALAALYAQAAPNVSLIRAQDFGLQRLGHFGYFRRTAPRALWDDALAWLRLSVER